jgi:hypothetical protein
MRDSISVFHASSTEKSAVLSKLRNRRSISSARSTGERPIALSITFSATAVIFSPEEFDYTTKEPDFNPVIPAGKTVCGFLYPENRQSGFARRSAWGGQKAEKQVDENFTESREKNVS